MYTWTQTLKRSLNQAQVEIQKIKEKYAAVRQELIQVTEGR